MESAVTRPVEPPDDLRAAVRVSNGLSNSATIVWIGRERNGPERSENTSFPISATRSYQDLFSSLKTTEGSSDFRERPITPGEKESLR